MLAPDCGMKYLPRDRAFGKLKALAEGAAIVRASWAPSAALPRAALRQLAHPPLDHRPPRRLRAARRRPARCQAARARSVAPGLGLGQPGEEAQADMPRRLRQGGGEQRGWLPPSGLSSNSTWASCAVSSASNLPVSARRKASAAAGKWPRLRSALPSSAQPSRAWSLFAGSCASLARRVPSTASSRPAAACRDA